MPGPKRCSSPGDDSDADLDAVLMAARKALQRGDGWTIDTCHYDRLRQDLEALGLPCNDASITIGLRRALAEILRLRRREDASYSGLEADQTLYDCRWSSLHFNRVMYIKFAMNGALFELMTLHEHTVRDER